MDMTKPDMTKMRRADRAISREDALAVIDRCTYGTLSLIATDGTPYAVVTARSCSSTAQWRG